MIQTNVCNQCMLSYQCNIIVSLMVMSNIFHVFFYICKSLQYYHITLWNNNLYFSSILHCPLMTTPICLYKNVRYATILLPFFKIFYKFQFGIIALWYKKKFMSCECLWHFGKKYSSRSANLSQRNVKVTLLACTNICKFYVSHFQCMEVSWYFSWTTTPKLHRRAKRASLVQQPQVQWILFLEHAWTFKFHKKYSKEGGQIFNKYILVHCFTNYSWKIFSDKKR